jgi:hypothetical protein
MLRLVFLCRILLRVYIAKTVSSKPVDMSSQMKYTYIVATLQAGRSGSPISEGVRYCDSPKYLNFCGVHLVFNELFPGVKTAGA